MTPARRSLHALAERLGVFVTDIQARMPLTEYYNWCKYYSEHAEGATEPAPEKVATDEDLLRFFGEHRN